VGSKDRKNHWIQGGWLGSLYPEGPGQESKGYREKV
jgi:hypothetical protein